MASKTQLNQAAKLLKELDPQDLAALLQENAKARGEEIKQKINEKHREIADLERELTQLGLSAPSAPKRRRRSSKGSGASMKDAIMSFLSSKKEPQSVSDILEAVQGNTESDNPRAIVSQALNALKKDGLVKNPSRGEYEAA